MHDRRSLLTAGRYGHDAIFVARRKSGTCHAKRMGSAACTAARRRMRTAIALLTVLTVTFAAGKTASAQQASESNASENAELAKKLSNPIADLVSLAAQDMRIGRDQMNTTH